MMKHHLAFLILLSGYAVTQAQSPAMRQERQRAAKSAFIKGTALQLQGGRHAEAILEFQEALRYDSSAVTLTAMGRSYVELGKIDRAEECVTAALRLDSAYRDGWEVLSEIQIAGGEYDLGLQSYEHVIRLSPTRRQIYTLARLYEPRDAARSAELYERYVSQLPDVGTYLRLADLYKRLGNVVKRIAALEKAYALDQTSRILVADLIDAYVQTGRISDATDLALRNKSLRRQDVDSADLWTYVLRTIASDSAVIDDYPADVRNVLDKTLSIFYNDFLPLANAGELALRAGDLNRAKTLFETAAQLVPVRNAAEHILHMCASYLLYEYPQEAMHLALHYQPSYPQDPRFLQVMGDAAVAMDERDKAIAYYRSALEINPLLVDGWIHLGIQTDNAGLHDESDQAYRHALALDPENAVALNNLAYLMSSRTASLDTARRLAVQAVNQQPTNPAFLDTYAWILFRLGEYDRSQSMIEQAIKYGGNATHYEHLGDILEQQGKIDQAVEAWNRAMSIDPDKGYLNDKVARYR